ncbi:MAG: CapA family protein [Clostridia bacterium]|nr:CapA family protein [Clostridia bacterium]
MDKRKLKIILLSASALLLLACVILCSKIVSWKKDAENGDIPVVSSNADLLTSTSAADTTPNITPSPEPVTYTEMTLLSTGDLIGHTPVIRSAQLSDGSYDFTQYTKYINDIVSSADYAVFNLESTIAGDEYGFEGYPTFNMPEATLTSMKDTGFDMCLFANNHTYDYGHLGLINTQNNINSSGLDYIGTRLDTESKSYRIIEANGIRLGLLNYTYETGDEGETVKFLNGIRLDTRSVPLVDSFNYNRLDKFYSEVKTRMDEMEKDGADAIVMYIHWGDEYSDYSNPSQNEIAQQLCNLGVDAIVGSHSHVVQESETLTSADGTHRTMCYYSTGNFLSNQGRYSLSRDPDGKTENSVLLLFTFRKYSTGEVVISNTDYVATWVHRVASGSDPAYTIVPLEKALANEDAKSYYGLYNGSDGVEQASAALKHLDGLLNEQVEVFNVGITLPYDDSEVTAAVD